MYFHHLHECIDTFQYRHHTVIDIDRDAIGNVCITAMDATGMIATGCGLMIERTYVVPMPCGEEQMIDTCSVRLPEVTGGSHCSIYRPQPKPDPRNERPYKEERKGDREPKPWREARSIDRDVRDPSPQPRPVADHDRGSRSGGGIYRDVSPSIDRGINSGGTSSRSHGTSGSGSGGAIYERYSNTGR